MLDRRTLPLSALRAFERTGHHLNMGKAGDDLGVTHGAISHQVRALEKELGVKLFIRANNRLQLTDSGLRLLKAVSEGFDRILDGTQYLDPDSLSGNLVVGCTQTAGANWLAQIIGDFHQEYPQITIRTVEIKPEQREIPREIDVAICYGEPIADDRRVEKLISQQIFPVCSPRMLHGAEASVTRPEDLTQFPLLHEGLDNWARWFTAMNISMPEHTKTILFFSTNLALSAARHGFGVALCNRYEAQQDLLEGRLIRLLDTAIPERNSYYLLAAQTEGQSLRARLFEEWLKDAFK